MFARPRLPRPNATRQCKCPSTLAWRPIQTTTRFRYFSLRGRSETHEPATLAWLLGYGDQVQPSGAPWPDLSELVLENANLSLRKVRFLSIDIDGLHQDKAGIRQFDIGVSILDAEQVHRQLRLPSSPRKNLAAHLIKSRYYIVEDPKHGSGRRTKFSFGGCRVMSLPKLREKLKEKVEGRNVVLVMHGAATEVSVMKSLNINLNPVFTIDTTTAVRHLFQRTNLKCLLKEYEIPHGVRNLHHAGNDAHFILRVLLMIAVRHVRTKLGGEQLPDWVPVFEAIARSPKPGVEEMRKEGPLRITPGDKERKQMERRRATLERIGRRLEKLSRIKEEKKMKLSRIEEGKEMMPWRRVQPILPDCDAMSPSWADHYTISQYGMLP
ncbi:hypothetical protein FALCPG4_016575 [Fusarium falciforme]